MLLIDGHNLTFADDRARDLLKSGDPERSRDRVLALVTRYAVRTGQRANVVFDGTGGPYRPQAPRSRVRYSFSGTQRSADRYIAELIERSTGPRDLCVVTNDRELLAAAGSLGAGTLRADEMLAELARARAERREKDAPEPRAKRAGPPPGEVEYWLREFPEKTVAEIEKEVRAERDRGED
ncbi:MAG: NYN domain-containing protein [Planctomycetota bacterium]